MASTEETGHAKNVTNFDELIAFVTGYGAPYNPSNTLYKLPNLIALQAEAAADLKAVVTDNTAFNNDVNDRFVEFSNVKGLSTRLTNAIEVTEASAQKIKDAKGFNRKMQGKKAAKAIVAIDLDAPAPNKISSSQQSFDQQIQHLTGLNSVLLSETTYIPNEADLKTAAVTAKINTLTNKNKKVDTSHTKVSNSRLKRDKTIYAEKTGIVDVALGVKKYVKALFKATSPEYAQISGIEFKRAKK